MKRNVLLIGGAAFVAIVLVWFFLFYSPLGDDLKSAQDSVSVEERKTQDLDTTLARLTATAKNAPQQQAELRKFDQAIPQKPDLGEFIIQLNKIATSAGIRFLSVSPSPPVASGTSSTIALTISIQGSFFQVKNYLTQLESLERLVIIDGVNISAGSGSSTSASATSDATSLSVTLTGRMFTRAAPAAAGTPSTPTTTTPGSSTSSTTVPGAATSSTTAPATSSTTAGGT
jgi:Tfp pilus assembly protein PilO